MRQQLARQDDEQRQHGDGGHAGRQPAQPVGAREQVADQPVDPQPDGQRDQDAERAEEDACRAASGCAARPPAAVRRRRSSGSSKTSISAGMTTATSDLRSRAACARRLGILGAAALSALSAWLLGSMRKAAGLRGALMPDGLRSGTAARGRA